MSRRSRGPKRWQRRWSWKAARSGVTPKGVVWLVNPGATLLIYPTEAAAKEASRRMIAPLLQGVAS